MTQQVKIESGPSEMDLAFSLFREQVVYFVVDGNYIHVNIQGIEAENDSGQCWNIKGKIVRTDDPKKFPVQAKFIGSYDYQKHRKGWLEIDSLMSQLNLGTILKDKEGTRAFPDFYEVIDIMLGEVTLLLMDLEKPEKEWIKTTAMEAHELTSMAYEIRQQVESLIDKISVGDKIRRKETTARIKSTIVLNDLKSFEFEVVEVNKTTASLKVTKDALGGNSKDLVITISAKELLTQYFEIIE